MKVNCFSCVPGASLSEATKQVKKQAKKLVSKVGTEIQAGYQLSKIMLRRRKRKEQGIQNIPAKRRKSIDSSATDSSASFKSNEPHNISEIPIEAEDWEKFLEEFKLYPNEQASITNQPSTSPNNLNENTTFIKNEKSDDNRLSSIQSPDNKNISSNPLENSSSNSKFYKNFSPNNDVSSSKTTEASDNQEDAIYNERLYPNASNLSENDRLHSLSQYPLNKDQSTTTLSTNRNTKNSSTSFSYQEGNNSSSFSFIASNGTSSSLNLSSFNPSSNNSSFVNVNNPNTTNNPEIFYIPLTKGLKAEFKKDTEGTMELVEFKFK